MNPMYKPKKLIYDSENGCTAEPSRCTLIKNAMPQTRDRKTTKLPLSLEGLLAPSAEEEYFAKLSEQTEESYDANLERTYQTIIQYFKSKKN